MIVAELIPFFLAVQLPTKDVAWPHGPEYIFTVHMNVTGIPQCPHHVSACGDPSGYRITSRLHCTPKRNDTLSCGLRHVDGFEFGEKDFANQRRNLIEAPSELLFNEKGVDSIVTSQLTRVYDLNNLKTVAEQLHPGSDFNNIGNGSVVQDVTASTIGKCNVTFDVYHRLDENAKPSRRNYQLIIQPLRLHMTSEQTLVIDKTTNLNDCSCYADSYFGKYGDKVVDERLKSNLDMMVSHMEINDASFSSSTTRKGTSTSNNKLYNITEITKVILEDIRPATRDAPAIVKPGETKIIANDDIRSISTG
ncbi:PREDICTED: uncharacterized protein LOC105565844 [Vollenhovia emeryi]|uniref:uncharacterized protein LOC105565844 n=1 Tax=Vollenhovia emeryi TaxID=411798 RepID=UPI0005F4FF8A|nr:PREDICTED: uncharacterized protein LOC105565844 [Vollenhovia emeryi]